jgi:hypothetical protein
MASKKSEFLARRVEIGHEQAMFKLLKILTANTVGIFFVRPDHWTLSISDDTYIPRAAN